jgi:hypothetical protein
MAVWSDSTFVNINSGGNYAHYGNSGDTWVPATPAGIKEGYGFAQVFSVRTTTASTGDQYVKITSPDLNQEWILAVRCASTAAADSLSNGYTVRQAGSYLWYYSGGGTEVALHGVTLPSGTATVEMRVVGTLVTVYVNGSALDSHNYSATPQTGQYAGFGSANGAVVVNAEGGDVGGAATVPAQVTALVATGGIGTQINLTWDVPDNGGAAITGFRIRRAPDVAGSPGTYTTLVPTTGSTTAAYSDTGLTLSQHWWYTVAAINSVGTGSDSTADDAIVADPPPPAFTEDFSNGLGMWTIARWRSQMSQVGNAGYVPPSSNDDLHYDGVSGTHTTPTGTGILPPYDIFVGSNDWLYVGGGAQNYGDTHLRCAQKMDLTGSGPWTIRLGFVPNINTAGLLGWSTLYATDKPMASPSMTGENSAGPVPQYGFSVRLDYSNMSDGIGGLHPAPAVFTYNNYVEAGEADSGHAIFGISQSAVADVVMTFTRSNMRITANGVVWFDRPWTIHSSLTSVWLYLGAHNHATRKYAPFPDSRSAIFSYFEFDGTVIPPQYSYAVPDSLVLTSGVGEDAAAPGINTGWGSPTGTLTIPSVPANVSSAQLVLSSHWWPDSPDSDAYYVRYSLNGHTTHDERSDYREGAGAYNYAFHVNPAELIQGDNTLNISLIGQSGAFPPYVGNISLLVEAFATGQIAIGGTVVPKLAIGGTAVRSLSLGNLEIWRAPLPPQVPTAPTLILLTAGSGTLAVRWSQPVARGSAITDYTIQYRTSPAGTYTAFAHTAQTTRTITITGLATTTAYDVRVAAVNSVGTGGWSNVLTLTTTGPPAAPAQVTGLTTGATTSTSVALTWTAPANGGSAITDYTVQYAVSPPGTSWTTFSHSASTATAITVTGLTAATTYVFRVAAVNAIGTGTPSAASSPVTPGAPVLYTDNFNRANSGTLGTPWVTVDAAIALASNRATASAAGGSSMKYNQTFANDQWAEVDMVCVPGSSGNSLGPAVRLGSAGGGAYFANYDASTQNIDVYRRDASGDYAEAVANYSTTGLSGTFKCRVEAEGSTIRMYINDVLRGTGTDATVASGQPGLWGAQYGATASADNFRCGNLPYTP